MGFLRGSDGIMSRVGLSNTTGTIIRSREAGLRGGRSSSVRDVMASKHCRFVRGVIKAAIGGTGRGLAASSGVSHVIAGQVLNVPVFVTIV